YWHRGRSPAYGEGIAYWALGEMVRRRAGIAESEDPSTARPSLAASVAGFITDESERSWVEERLAALLGLAEAPVGEREELFAAWRLYFERIADRGTVVLAFEDLHLADEGLLDFIESVLEWSRSKPILVIGLSRPELMERRPTWGMGGRASVTLHLDAVATDGITTLLRGLVPGLPQATIVQIAERSEGVPLFAVETVRMLLDDGRLVREGERFRLSEPEAAFAIPPTLQALIAARLDALDPQDRGLVQDASVLGRTFYTAALAAVSGRDASEIEARMTGMTRKELFVLETDPRLPEHGQWGFVHGLFREISYGTLSKRDRRTRHLAAARYFETLDDDELAGVLASHYVDAYRAAPEGEEGEAVAAQARVALRAAAERALSLHANSAAVAFFEQALTVTPDAGERAAILLRMAEPAEAGLGIEASMRYLREAMEWYESQGDAGSTDAAIARLARAMLQLSMVDEAEAVLEPAVARIKDNAPTKAAAQVLNEYARVLLFRGIDAAGAVAQCERGLAIAERLRAQREMAELFITKSWAVTGIGRPQEAQILGVGGLQLAQRVGVVISELRARMNLSNAYISDDPRQAVDVAEAGIELAKRVGHGDWAASLAANAAAGALLAGDWDRVLRYEQELDSEHLSSFSRYGVIGPAGAVRAFRGLPRHGSDDTAWTSTMLASASAQDRGAIHASQAWTEYASGQLREAGVSARMAVKEMPEMTEALMAMVMAAHATIELRDPDALREQLARTEGLEGSTGEWLLTSVAEIHGALDWMEGRPIDGERAFRDAIKTWRRLDLPFEILQAELGMIVLGGRRLHDFETLVEEARSIGTQLRAAPLLERLEAFISEAEGSAAAPSSAPADHRVAAGTATGHG
ncbi:MAG: hypothetical protein ABIZ34_01625, partial [Candidatus Limnocylindrales bacterium]